MSTSGAPGGGDIGQLDMENNEAPEGKYSDENDIDEETM